MEVRTFLPNKIGTIIYYVTNWTIITKKDPFVKDLHSVRGRGVEPPRLSALPPQGSVYTISPPALNILFLFTISPLRLFTLYKILMKFIRRSSDKVQSGDGPPALIFNICINQSKSMLKFSFLTHYHINSTLGQLYFNFCFF